MNQKKSNTFLYDLICNIEIIGDSEESVQHAKDVVSKIIDADEATRNYIRTQQLREAQEMNSTIYGQAFI